jgi:murein DD-endopeptidase MepM/ murein hydrolase activator NlpD
LPAAGAEDPVKAARRERDHARAAQAQAAKQLDLLSAEDAQVTKALEDIDQAVAAQEAQVADAQRALDGAVAEAAQRQARVAEVEQSLARARTRVADVAVDQYVGRGADDVAVVLLDARDVNDAIRRGALLEYLHDSRRDAVAALRALEAERGDALDAATRAVRESDRRRAELTDLLAVLQDRRATQIRLRDEVQRRMAEWAAQEDQLERDEAELTELIKKKQLESLNVAPGDPGAASLRGFVLPSRGPLGSGFGPRMHPIFHVVRPHNGLDMGGRTGDPILAAKEGRVIFAGQKIGFGNVIIIQHAGSVSTVYAHLSKLGASAGEWVATGELIGLMGATGWATGPHLHFEVRVNGEPKDPMLFLP